MKAGMIGAMALGGAVVAALGWTYFDLAGREPIATGEREPEARNPPDVTAGAVSAEAPPGPAEPEAEPDTEFEAGPAGTGDVERSETEAPERSPDAAPDGRVTASPAREPERIAAAGPAAGPDVREATETPAPAQEAPGPEARAPRLDIVRVDADGQTVIAGRATPNESVEVLLDGEVVDTVLADASGRFVAIVTANLAGEPRELRLRITLPERPRPPGGGPVAMTGEPSAETMASVGRGPDAAPASGSTPKPPEQVSALREDATVPTREEAPAPDSDALSDPQGTASHSAAATASPEASGGVAGTGAGADETGPSPAGSRREPATVMAEPGTDLALLTQDGSEPVPAETAARDEPRHLLSEPIIILPAERAEQAPALVQPQEDELAMLQPGGADGGAAGGVVLDQLTRDPDGRLLLRGRARPGHAVRIYGNGRVIETVPARDGAWSVTVPDDRVEELQLLRLDEIGRAGQVTSRVEVPFEPSNAPSQVVRDRRITVQRGDNLWRIAEQHYGEGIRYSVIFGANSELIRDPDLIYPDQVFTIPELVEAE